MDNSVIEVAGFPITPDVILKKRGTHLGLSFEIVNSRRSTFDYSDMSRQIESGGTWCYYVSIYEAQLPSGGFEEFWLPAIATPHRSGWPRISFDYYGARFSQADWHGGVTYYEQLGGLNGEQRCVKIGCDFAHLWDEGQVFDYDEVASEAKATIEQLVGMYSFLRRCPYYGTYHADADMVAHPLTGALYSVEGMASLVDSK